MTGRNISQWLLKTRDDFYKRRYGGFEFGVSNPVSKLDMESLEDAFTRYTYTIQIYVNFHFPFWYADLIVQVTWASTESAVLQKAPPLMLPRIIFGKTAPLTSSEFGLTTKVGFSFIPQRLVLNNTQIPTTTRLGGQCCIHECCEQRGVASGGEGGQAVGLWYGLWWGGRVLWYNQGFIATVVATNFNSFQYGIKLINHPMNYTEVQLDKELM